TALLSLPAIVLLELADPTHAAAYVPLLILPVAWSALYEDLRRLAGTLLLTAIALGLPVLLIGAPDYPSSSWRRSLLWLVVLAVTGQAISALVATTRRAAAQAQASELRYRIAFTEAPTPIAIIGVEGAERGRILQANHPLEALVGAPADGLVGHAIDEFIDPRDLADAAAMLSGTEGGRVRNVELRLRQASGARWIAASIAMVRYAVDEPLRCVCHVEDVTRRRESEQALHDALAEQGAAASQLEEVARARGEVVAAVSHDVRTPLATIGAYVQLLESGDAGELTADQRAMVGVIEENLRRTYAITDDLLTLGRMERAAADQPEAEVQVSDLLEQVVRSVEPSARVRNQQVRMDVHLGASRVTGHAAQLDRAITNLLTNAVKFTPEGGTITVRGYVDGSSVVIQVSDTGVGIAADEQSKIFDRFYRSEGVRRRKVSGTGLGLAIAREIAVLHGGTITVESAPGEGATFTLTLPARVPVA
ncbi:MAG TPA: PAS domain-containing sensor histidine kinase, partial [Solirubrobacteraceae bacterium]|nr:PAS domain-containing sensor histidine kinase [Solirubrobacteraceae bacterium]